MAPLNYMHPGMVITNIISPNKTGKYLDCNSAIIFLVGQIRLEMSSPDLGSGANFKALDKGVLAAALDK